MRAGARVVPPGAGDVQVRLLGGFALLEDGEQVDVPPATQRVVALLALHRRPAPRSVLAGRLWPEAAEEEALARLRSALWRLRQRCCLAVEAHGRQVRLAKRAAVDVADLEEHAHRLLDTAAALRAGDEDPSSLCTELLPDWWEDWVVIERERLRQLRLHALELLAERLAGGRRFARALEVALAAMAIEPLRESPHRLVVGIHLAEGNRSEALRAYRAYESLLRAELGVGPSPRIEALVRDIRAGQRQSRGQAVT